MTILFYVIVTIGTLAVLGGFGIILNQEKEQELQEPEYYEEPGDEIY